MANKHMEGCSPSLAIRAMQTKTTVRDYFPPTGVAAIRKKWKIASVDEDVEKWERHAQLVAM